LENEDTVRKVRLEKGGEAVVGDDVVLWMPRGAIAREEALKLLEEYQRGIGAAKKKIGRPDWNHRGDRRV
jgi:hypothetical protein